MAEIVFTKVEKLDTSMRFGFLVKIDTAIAALGCLQNLQKTNLNSLENSYV